MNKALLLLSTASVAAGFQHGATKSSVRMPLTLKRRFPTSVQDGFLVESDGSDTTVPSLEDEDFLVVEEDVSNILPPQPEAGFPDVGKELFLGSISNTRPEDIAPVLDVAQDAVDAMLGENPASLIPEEPLIEKHAAALEEETPLIEITMDDENENGTVSTAQNDDFMAVFAAAGEAAEAVEASMSEKDIVIGGPAVAETTPIEIVPSSEVVGKPPHMEAPPVSKILKFAIPAIGVWLCSPLLSLIDTSAVGVLAGTIHQAALNPAVAVTDYAALLIAFMYTGTTNLVAAAQSKDAGVEGKPRTTKTLTGAMQLSTYVGLGLGTILFVFARQLLKGIIGNDGISPEVFAAAMKYVRIRALGMPAAAIIGSAQAACLGMQDIRSPLYVLLAAAVVNFFGDMIFVGSANPWIGGAAGAAWATVFSQYAAVAFFVRWMTHVKKDKTKSNNQQVVNLSKAIMEMTGRPESDGESRRSQFQRALASVSNTKRSAKASSLMIRSKLARVLQRSKVDVKQALPKKDEKKKSDSFSVRGFLANKFSMMDLLRLPKKEITKEFSPYVLPVTSTQFGRVSGYVAMSHVVASSLGTVSMAAQQVIVSLFYCLCPVADALGLTAQSFVPSIFQQEASPERAAALRKTTRNFLKAGTISGLALMGAVASIPLLSGFFTADPTVSALVNSVVPFLLGFFMVHGWLCASEGLLLGQTDLGFLGKMYGMFFFAVPYFMLQVKRVALSGAATVGLTSVWQVFLGYQLFRVSAWVFRVLQLQRRTERQVNTASVQL